MLSQQGGWCSLGRLNSHVSHSSHVSPISYTHQEREGETDEEKEGESQGAERGKGEENEEFDMLCA